jgi:hypothetical protein
MLPKLSADSHLAWNMHYQESTERQLLLCQEWTHDLRQFFGIGTTANEVSSIIRLLMMRLIEFQSNIPLLAVVEALQQMRATDQSIWGTEYWRECVKSSGLADAIAYICQPDTKLERSQPYISQSFRYHAWRESLGEILERWTPSVAFNLEIPEEVGYVCHVAVT